MFCCCRDQQGQALLELALVLPILMLLVFGIVQFGIIFLDNQVITQAAREGVRVGTVGGSDAEIMETVEHITENLDSTRLEVVINPSEGERSRGDSLKVEVHYSAPIIFPVIGEFISNPYPLTAAVVMRVE